MTLPALQPRALRKLLYSALRTDSELSAFCLDFFPDTMRLFSDGMDREAKTTLLITREDQSTIIRHLCDINIEAVKCHIPAQLIPSASDDESLSVSLLAPIAPPILTERQVSPNSIGRTFKPTSREDNSTESLIRRGISYADTGSIELAISNFSEAIYRGDNSVQALFFRAIARQQQGNLKDSLRDLDDAIRIDQGNYLLFLTRAEILCGIKQYTIALFDVERALLLAPNNDKAAEALCCRAKMYQETGQSKLAINDLESAIELSPNQSEAYFQLGLLKFLAGELKESIELLTLAQKNCTSDPRILTSRALVYNNNNEFTKAIVDCDAALRLSFLSPYAHYMRAIAHFGIGQYSQAIIDCSSAIENAIDSKMKQDFLRYRAKIHGHVGNYQQWEHDLRESGSDRIPIIRTTISDVISLSQVILSDPSNIDMLLDRALVYLDQEKLDNALDDVSQVIKLKPRYAAAYHVRGTIYLEQGDTKSALKDFKNAIRHGDGLAVLSCAMAYDARKDWKSALVIYGKFIETNPHHAFALVRRGFLHGRMGRNDLALQDCTKALKITPHYAKAYLGCGIAYSHLGDHRRAMQNFEEAIKLDPSEAEAIFAKGQIYEHEGRMDLAMEAFSRAIELEPDNAEFYNRRAMLYFERNLYRKASTDWSMAIKLDPNNYENYYHRGLALARLGKHLEALENYDATLRIKNDLAEGLFGRGGTLYRLGRYQEALSDLSKVLAAERDNANALFIRGLCYVHLAENEKAAADYFRARDIKPKEIDGFLYQAEFVPALLDAARRAANLSDAEVFISVLERLVHILKNNQDQTRQVVEFIETNINVKFIQSNERYLFMIRQIRSLENK